MSLPQASFVAGAAIHQAHQASALAVEAASAAQNYQRESQQAQQFAQHVMGVAQHREQLHEAEINRLAQEANQRHLDAQAEVTRTQDRAREVVEQTMHSAQQAVGRSEQELQQRAQQYVSEQESRLRAEMESQVSRLKGEALSEVASRERRIAELEAQLQQQQAAAVSIPKSAPVTPKALSFTPPQTQIVIHPQVGTPATNIAAGSPMQSHNPFAVPITETDGQITISQQVPQPPPGHPVDPTPPGFPGRLTGGLQMNPNGGSQQGAPSLDLQRQLEDELLRTRGLFENFVAAMQPMLDVLTPEQRAQIALRTGNQGTNAPPVPIAAPMQATGNISGAAPDGAPPPQQIYPPGLPPLPLGQVQAYQAGVASGCGGGGSPSCSSSSSTVGQVLRHHQVTRRGCSQRPQIVLTVVGYMILQIVHFLRTMNAVVAQLATRMVKTCRKGHFGLTFQQMVELERTQTGGMPCGRGMLKKVLSHFQLERDRLGMLGERNLLTMKLAGNSSKI